MEYNSDMVVIGLILIWILTPILVMWGFATFGEDLPIAEESNPVSNSTDYEDKNDDVFGSVSISEEIESLRAEIRDLM